MRLWLRWKVTVPQHYVTDEVPAYDDHDEGNMPLYACQCACTKLALSCIQSYAIKAHGYLYSCELLIHWLQANHHVYSCCR